MSAFFNVLKFPLSKDNLSLKNLREIISYYPDEKPDIYDLQSQLEVFFDECKEASKYAKNPKSFTKIVLGNILVSISPNAMRVKAMLPTENLDLYISEFLYRQANPKLVLDLFPIFLTDIVKVYPGYGKVGLSVPE